MAEALQLTRRSILGMLALAGAGCGGGADPEPASALDLAVAPLTPAPAALSVESITKLAERRIERAIFEFDYAVSVASSVAVGGVAVTLSQVGTGTVIVQPTAAVGPIAAGAVVRSTGFVTFRHDRELPFLTSALRWELRAQ